MRTVVRAVDLFAGAGGTSTGLVKAMAKRGKRVDLLAINHNTEAIATHTKNHPHAVHICENLNAINPHVHPEVLRLKGPSRRGTIDLLVASPECTHHSVARGSKPISDQSRATAWHVVQWAEACRPRAILVENVREFANWGPLNEKQRPIKSKKGETFNAWLNALRSLGYTVDHRVLCAADYGDATTRRRLFVMAYRGKKVPSWPEATHSQKGDTDLFGSRARWRAAREVIDWSLKGTSIFGRKKPLSANTMRRIIAGLKKFCRLPFLVPTNYGERQGQSPRTHDVEDPMPTVVGTGAHALCEPFIVNISHTTCPDKKYAHDVNTPLTTVTSIQEHGLCEPFILSAGGPQVDAIGVSQPMNTVLTRDHKGPHMAVVEPLPTTSAGGTHQGLCQPFILPHRQFKEMQVDDINDPLRTVTAHNGGDNALIEPFLVNCSHTQDKTPRVRSVNELAPAITETNDHAVVEPFLVSYHEGIERRVHDLDKPLPPQETSNRFGVAEPFLTKYQGTGGPHAVTEPVDTVSTHDRYGLAVPELTKDGTTYRLDVRFRMLQPHELAAAMGFPQDYEFVGNRAAKVRQIGNAVCVNLAEALCLALLD